MQLTPPWPERDVIETLIAVFCNFSAIFKTRPGRGGQRERGNRFPGAAINLHEFLQNCADLAFFRMTAGLGG